MRTRAGVPKIPSTRPTGRTDPPRAARGESPMGKIVHCRDVGFDCEGIVRGPDEASVLSDAAAHAQAVHGVAEITPEIVAKVRSVIRDDAAAS